MHGVGTRSEWPASACPSTSADIRGRSISSDPCCLLPHLAALQLARHRGDLSPFVRSCSCFPLPKLAPPLLAPHPLNQPMDRGPTTSSLRVTGRPVPSTWATTRALSARGSHFRGDALRLCSSPTSRH